MAKKEFFQAVLNDMLEQIRLDALDCLEHPPEKEVNTYDLEDLADKALEYHTKGDAGTYLYFLALHKIKSLEKDLKDTDDK